MSHEYIVSLYENIMVLAYYNAVYSSMMAYHDKFLWRHNGRDGVSNHQPHGCLLNRLFRRRSKKTSKLRVTGLCEGNSPLIGEFPAQMASNAEMFKFDDVTMTQHVRKCIQTSFRLSFVSLHLGTGLFDQYLSVLLLFITRHSSR